MFVLGPRELVLNFLMKDHEAGPAESLGDTGAWGAPAAPRCAASPLFIWAREWPAVSKLNP